jgi:hypothetical protein
MLSRRPYTSLRHLMLYSCPKPKCRLSILSRLARKVRKAPALLMKSYAYSSRVWSQIKSNDLLVMSAKLATNVGDSVLGLSQYGNCPA